MYLGSETQGIPALAQRPRRLARQLEGLLWQVLVRELDRGSHGGFMPGGLAGGLFGDMLRQALAEQASASSNLGLAEVLTRQLGLDAGEASAYPRLPVAGRISSGFGMRSDPLDGRHRFHRGMDIAAAAGTPIRSSGAGRVIQAGELGGLGLAVVVQQTDGARVIYGHCRRLLVEAGQVVSSGQPLAEVGQTGRATGPHLHFEVHLAGKAVDPADYLAGRLAGVKNLSTVSMFSLDGQPLPRSPGGK